MKDLCAPDWWYDIPVERERMCAKCNEKDQTLDNASEFLEEVVKQLYSVEALDISKLEHCLDELCHLMKVKMIPGDLMIARQQPKKIYAPGWLNNWVAKNNKYLNQLNIREVI